MNDVCVAVHPPTYMKHTAVVGQSYTVPSRPDTNITADVRWFFDSSGGSWRVYEYGYVAKKFKDRFSLNTSVHGLYGVDISNVQQNDTGNYTCIEKGGHGDHHVHHLTVHGKLGILCPV